MQDMNKRYDSSYEPESQKGEKTIDCNSWITNLEHLDNVTVLQWPATAT
jgi:hypothetical protein